MELIEELRNRSKELYIETNDEKYRLISQILEDDKCFLVLDANTAFDILNSLGIKNTSDLYNKLISSSIEDENIIYIKD